MQQVIAETASAEGTWPETDGTSTVLSAIPPSKNSCNIAPYVQGVSSGVTASPQRSSTSTVHFLLKWYTRLPAELCTAPRENQSDMSPISSHIKHFLPSRSTSKVSETYCPYVHGVSSGVPESTQRSSMVHGAHFVEGLPSLAVRGAVLSCSAQHHTESIKCVAISRIKHLLPSRSTSTLSGI
jgi:hypothetical protein